MDLRNSDTSILLINKPVGPTSHDIVARIRTSTGIQRVGHAGTLDPFAEGLLIVLVGRDATKRQSEFLHMNKTYEAVIHLGATSTTEDPTGTITPRSCDPVDSSDVTHACASFVGTYDQMPSTFSAKKIRGVPAYKLARAGETPLLTPKNITIHSLDIIDYSWPLLTIRVHVSSGTYIRALARDIGEKLRCGAYVQTLKRTSIGPYSLADAQSI